jgi:nucleoside-diphosphate-sugar epimerase
VRIFDLIDVPDRPTEVEFVQGDIRDLAAVRRACEGMDVVYHNVAQVPLVKNNDLFWSVNKGGTATLLEAAHAAGVKKVVHTSSSAIFGIPSHNPVDWRVELTPVEEYGRAKLAGEDLIRRFVDEHHLDVTIIRPRTVIGHLRLGIFEILFDWVADGRNIPVFGTGNHLFQFVHSDDLAEACISAAARPGFAVYSIGAERFGTMREILEALCKHAGTGSKLYSVPLAPAVAVMSVLGTLRLSPLAPFHIQLYGQSFYYDVSRPMRELNWTPKYSNDETICESYDWYMKNRESIRRQAGASVHRSPVKQGVLALIKRFS